jgi:hypothetical protein
MDKDFNCILNKKLFIQNIIVFTIIVIFSYIVYTQSINSKKNYYKTIDEFNSDKKILCSKNLIISKDLGWSLASKSDHITNDKKLIDFLQCEPYGE